MASVPLADANDVTHPEIRGQLGLECRHLGPEDETPLLDHRGHPRLDLGAQRVQRRLGVK